MKPILKFLINQSVLALVLGIGMGIGISVNIPEAQAGTTNASTKATATINGACQVSATNINFGEFSPSNTGALYINSSVNVLCSKGMSYKVILSSGGTPSQVDSSTGYGTATDLNVTFIRTANPIFTTSYPSGAARIMTGTRSSDQLVFNLYSDSAYSVPFIDSFYLTETGTGVAQSIPVYAKLPLQQWITPDNYTQSVEVVLEY